MQISRNIPSAAGHNKVAEIHDRRVFIRTFGCQMNVYDSERMLEELAEDNYRKVDKAADANLIIVNTCSVRGKAEQKLFSILGIYRRIKASKEGVIICVTGCVAQQQRSAILERAPFVDLVIGPDNIHKIGNLVRRARECRERIVETAFTDPAHYVFHEARPQKPSGARAFVTIQKGCNKMCSYCIVPFTRGREVSRPFQEVISEVQAFIDAGAVEITLIGQNVNCYSGGSTFAELLHMVAGTKGLKRLRYATSHPGEMGEDIFLAHEKIPVLCPHIHLPVQSGSDRILALMRREHTAREYIEKVENLRKAVPDIAITTDIIVGFPDETEEDFELTMKLMEEIRFTNMYSFIYSNRPKTWAARHSDSLGRVSYEEKVGRLEKLQARQREISAEYTAEYMGDEIEVLVEGPSKRDDSRIQGHSIKNWTVHFPAPENKVLPGSLVKVRIDSAGHVGLSGIMTEILYIPDRCGDK